MKGIRAAREIVKDYRSIDSIDHRKIYKNRSMDYRSIDSIDGEIVKNDDSAPSQYRQRAIAERLLKKLGEPKSWKFYLKCAYHLSEDRIWTLVELATRPGIIEHNRYFVCLANKEMGK